MMSVTQRIKYIKQPKGGYLPLKLFTKSFIDNDNEFINNDEENIHSSLIGLSVDYLTRYLISEHLKMKGVKRAGCSFGISFTGASNLDKSRGIDSSSDDSEFSYAFELESEINTTLDDISIINACRLSGYDVCYRTGVEFYKEVRDINPNQTTINHIRKMVKRVYNFLMPETNNIIVGRAVPDCGATIITHGDYDFIKNQTLIDLKVSINTITTKHTLQGLIYALMLNKPHSDDTPITSIGFYNPRYNCYYHLELSSIPLSVIDEVERYVIGYDIPKEIRMEYLYFNSQLNPDEIYPKPKKEPKPKPKKEPKPKPKSKYELQKEERLGQIIEKYVRTFKIIEYYSSMNITIQWDNGDIETGKRYDHLIKNAKKIYK